MDYDDPFDCIHAHCRKMELEYIRARNDYRDHEASYTAYEEAQNQRRSMQAHLGKIQQLVGAEGGQLQSHLKALQEALASQSSLLDKLVQSVPPMARRPPNTDELADRVFSIPELLERILVNLTAGDLLFAMRVNRQFFDAIEASPRIQMRMGLRAQENCHIRFPAGPMELYALSLSVDGYYGYTSPRHGIAEDEVTMRADIYISERNPLPKPGKRCREVVPIDTLHAETGIRIGDLLDAYARTAEAHKLCPDAIADLHDDEGFVVPRISFEANVAALEDDPKLLARRRLDNKRKADNERWALKEQKLGPYITAKRAARDNGEPIPTLAQFERARDEAAMAEAPIALP